MTGHHSIPNRTVILMTEMIEFRKLCSMLVARLATDTESSRTAVLAEVGYVFTSKSSRATHRANIIIHQAIFDPSPTTMATVLWRIPTYLLSAICFYGAFSRLTHGQYTKNYYAWQESHYLNNGSLQAQIGLMVDLLFGVIVLYPRTRPMASTGVRTFFLLGLIMHVGDGKSYAVDVMLVALSTLASFTVNRGW